LTGGRRRTAARRRVALKRRCGGAWADGLRCGGREVGLSAALNAPGGGNRRSRTFDGERLCVVIGWFGPGVFVANVCRVDRVLNEAVCFQPLVRVLGDVTAIQLSTIEEATASGVRPAVNTVASAR